MTEEEGKQKVEKGRILDDAAEEPVSEPPHPEIYVQTNEDEEEVEVIKNRIKKKNDEILPVDEQDAETARK